MGSKKPYPAKLHPIFAATFNQVFGEPLPKKATKPKDKEKKGGKDE